MDWSWRGLGGQLRLCKPSHPSLCPLCATLCLLAIAHAAQANSTKHALPPRMKDQPFQVYWNIPTAKFSTLQLEEFGIVTNEREEFIGENITIFYVGQLGKYPHYNNGQPVDGGFPQNASLKGHTEKMKIDVQKYLSRNFKGLAVIDWEEWRPLYQRNWGKKNIYREKSQELVQVKHPDWSPTQIREQAQKEFDKAARNFMRQTLMLGQALRPQALWGFYLFPDCYNYHYGSQFAEFSGLCPAIEIKRNNQLRWLWSQSDALYPSVYLEESLKSSERGKLYARWRIHEAMRLSLVGDSEHALPVYVYSRSNYMVTQTLRGLTRLDLIHTIGQSAAMGARGVILWGGIDFSRTKRKGKASSTYFKGHLSSRDKRQMRAHFKCQCYKGWKGIQCNHYKKSLACREEHPLFSSALLLLIIYFLC
ncbi:hyaluronidase-2-like isoform X2 [Narcine bancroftii]|uniref:hyaluronidase-2-like isoform X2 n=1 Tax=Narcine bancroftii TaxID=1343680 RepID=UPI003831CD9F